MSRLIKERERRETEIVDSVHVEGEEETYLSSLRVLIYIYIPKNPKGEMVCIWGKQISSCTLRQLSMLIIVIHMDYPKLYTKTAPKSTMDVSSVVHLLFQEWQKPPSFEHRMDFSS